MREIDKNLHALEHNVVGLSPFDVGDKADAAPVMLVLRAVQPLRWRQTPKWIKLAHVFWLFKSGTSGLR
jgi:hypothetical protein